MSEPPPGALRRFYKAASVVDIAEGFGVLLDTRALRTPSGAPFAAPSRALAELCAAEWNAQETYVIPARLPLTRLVNVALDRAPQTREALAAHVAKFAETDLTCHRAEAPAALVARQAEAWDPIVAWAQEALGAAPPVVVGIVAAPVAADVIDTFRAHAEALDDFRLTGLAHAAGLAGSALIAFALTHGRLDGAQAFSAAALDDLFSLENWGEDAEARARLDGQAAEFEALANYFAALAE
jgi:chaperone required for assembly of F1-ATPase